MFPLPIAEKLEINDITLKTKNQKTFFITYVFTNIYSNNHAYLISKTVYYFTIMLLCYTDIMIHCYNVMLL